MTKKNLSQIMKRAWEIKKEDIRNIFGICLKMSWIEFKSPKKEEKVKLEGSEKQIAWAEKIRVRMIEEIKEKTAKWEAKQEKKFTEGKAEIIKALGEILEKIENRITYASTLIEGREDWKGMLNNSCEKFTKKLAEKYPHLVEVKEKHNTRSIYYML
ncbi:MAG: hypothetical protein RR420_08515 [Anaerovoracaceae bacterium]